MKYFYGIIGILLTIAFLISGCVTPEPTAKEVGSVMATGLNAVMNLNMTKAEMLEQAGPPMEKAPLDNGGELWVYLYQKQKTHTIPDQVVSVGKKTYNLGGGRSEIHDYAMKVNIKFNQAGRMIGWGYDGNLAVFPDNPFTRLTPPLRSGPTAASAQFPSIEEQRKHISKTLDALLRAGTVSQRHVLLQAGVPQEMPQPEGGKFASSFVYTYSRPSDTGGKPYALRIRIRFNEKSRMADWEAKGQLWLVDETPFGRFRLPDPGETAGQWVTDPSSQVKALFDAFPSGCSAKWEGGSVPLPNGERLADGKGILRIYDPIEKELGAYVGLFKAGVPAGDIRLIKADPASPPIEGLALGAVSWR